VRTSFSLSVHRTTSNTLRRFSAYRVPPAIDFGPTDASLVITLTINATFTEFRHEDKLANFVFDYELKSTLNIFPGIMESTS